jgi:hypothetical protein
MASIGSRDPLDTAPPVRVEGRSREGSVARPGRAYLAGGDGPSRGIEEAAQSSAHGLSELPKHACALGFTSSGLQNARKLEHLNTQRRTAIDLAWACLRLGPQGAQRSPQKESLFGGWRRLPANCRTDRMQAVFSDRNAVLGDQNRAEARGVRADRDGLRARRAATGRKAQAQSRRKDDTSAHAQWVRISVLVQLTGLP